MATEYQTEHPVLAYFRAVRWQDGAMAGLIVGTVLFFLSRGIPWIGSGAIDPAILGREIAPGQEPSSGFFMGIFAMHLIICTLYGLILAPIVNGFKPIVAGFVGGLVGLVLYFLDFAIFSAILNGSSVGREWSSVLMHIVFGIVTAEAYKGMTRRQWQEATVPDSVP
jgi:hypothetical protein